MSRAQSWHGSASRICPPRQVVLRSICAVALAIVAPSLGGCLAAHHTVSALRGEPAQKELLLDLPPVDLPAQGDHHATPQPEPFWYVWTVDAYLQGFTIEVVDGQGNLLPEAILHHVKIMTPGRRELFAPIMQRIVGAGSETRAGSLPHTFGVPVQAGDSLLVTAMVHNPDGREYPGARVRLRLRYTPGAEASRVAAVYPFFLHVTPPAAHSGYDLPPGRSERSWEASPTIGGRVIGFGGHMHRYGTELRLEDAGTGQVLWRSRIKTDADGNVLAVPRSVYRWTRGLKIEADRVYRITAVYQNPTPDTLPDAGMGTIGGAIRVNGSWPPVDRSDALYVRDRALEEGTDHHHHHSHH